MRKLWIALSELCNLLTQNSRYVIDADTCSEKVSMESQVNSAINRSQG